jgi:hypothetical protein
MAIRFDYSRGGRRLSWRGQCVIAAAPVPRALTVAAGTVLAALLTAAVGWAQYPGQISTTDKSTPELRSIAVVEWVGVEGKPTRSRIVPVAVLDQGVLEPGGLYLARPVPLALDGGVEYELEQNGKAVGWYDVRSAANEQGSWVGFGMWKPLVKAQPKPAAQMAQVDVDDSNSDEPVLHRKHHPGDAQGGSGNGGSSGRSAPAPDRPTLHRSDSSDNGSTTGSSGSGSSADSNGPVLHRRDASDSSGNTTDSTNSGNSAGSTTSSAPAPDPDRPTLHKPSSNANTASASAPDPDRPRLKKDKEIDDQPYVSSVETAIDPNRPRLLRGVYTPGKDEVPPSLVGMPVEMQQVVAVSDAKPIPEHPWSYSWANPDDEKKMQAELEDIARKDLGLTPPAPAPVKTSAHHRAPPSPPPPPPAPLLDEHFRIFELAYGSGATLVLSARTNGEGAEEKFITLIAQPDLYGNPLVLFKSVTDAAHLNDTPRMRLIDAVDAMADNRGELLFELRGATQRQFALYRVLRGQVQQLFVSGSTPL